MYRAATSLSQSSDRSLLPFDPTSAPSPTTQLRLPLRPLVFDLPDHPTLLPSARTRPAPASPSIAPVPPVPPARGVPASAPPALRYPHCILPLPSSLIQRQQNCFESALISCTTDPPSSPIDISPVPSRLPSSRRPSANPASRPRAKLLLRITPSAPAVRPSSSRAWLPEAVLPGSLPPLSPKVMEAC
jgi:hypothetical protein